MAYKMGILFSNGIFRSQKKNTLSPAHSSVLFPSSHHLPAQAEPTAAPAPA